MLLPIQSLTRAHSLALSHSHPHTLTHSNAPPAISLSQTDLRVLGDHLGDALSVGLGDNATLATLELWQCELQDWPSLIAFFESLGGISIGGNGNSGSGHAVTAPGLRALSVAHNHLQPPSLCALADALAANQSLHAVELTGNYGGADVLHSLARALQSNRTLRRLKLPDAHPEQPLVVQEQALRTLIEAVSVNTTLAELHVGAAAAQGLTFELKRHVVETLASAGNSVLGLITSNIELIYSDMGDLQHDVRAIVCGC